MLFVLNNCSSLRLCHKGLKGENGEEIIADDMKVTGNMEGSGDGYEKPEFKGKAIYAIP